MIQLDEKLFIGKGHQRCTYHYPNQDNLCIKINHNSKLAKHRQEREIKFFRSLKRKKVPFDYISDFIEKIDTNLGEGCVFEIVRDYDGEVSCSLFKLLNSSKVRDEVLLQKVRKLGTFLLKNRIFFHDNLPMGNVLCRKNADFSYDLVIIDGLGDTVFFPILNYIPQHANARILKKWNKYVVQPLVKKIDWISEKDLEI